MPKGLQVALTGAVGQVHKFLDDGSILIGSGSSAQGVTNKSATFFETARTGSATFYGKISASAEISASAYWGDGSNLTGISSVDVTDSTANTAFPVVLHNESTGGLHDDTSAFTYNPSTGLLSAPKLDVDDVIIDGATIGHTDDTDLLTLANGVVTVAGEVSMTTLDIGGTNVTATAAELNYLDVTTLGTSEASKALTADASGDITVAGAAANMVWDKSEDALEY